jgi:hypothetical protein
VDAFMARDLDGILAVADVQRALCFGERRPTMRTERL